MAPGPLYRVRRMALALREAHEITAWGEPAFRLRNSFFAMYASAGKHGFGYDCVWCRMPYDEMIQMVEAAPDRFFEAPFIGPLGWLGVFLDAKTDWKELRRLMEASYRSVLPSSLRTPPYVTEETASAKRRSPERTPKGGDAAKGQKKGRAGRKRKK